VKAHVAAVASAVAILWAAGNPAAVAADAPVADTRPAADQLASAVYDVASSRENAVRVADKVTKSFPPEWPADWPALFADAVLEETNADRGALDHEAGSVLSAHLSPEEIQVGLAFMKNPDGLALMRRLSVGDTAPADPQADALLTGLMSDPAGRSFVTKLRDFSAFKAEVDRNNNGRWLAGILRRFGAKAETAQIAAIAAEGEAGRLQADLACTLLPADQLKVKLGSWQLGPPIQAVMQGISRRSDWELMFDKALSDEIAASTPALCAAMGHQLAKDFTVEDDRAVLAFLQTPSGRSLRTELAQSIQGQTPLRPSGAAARQIQAFTATRLGRALSANLERLTDSPARQEYEAALAAGAFRRFGELALAGD
jgi:hypothetical protein